MLQLLDFEVLELILLFEEVQHAVVGVVVHARFVVRRELRVPRPLAEGVHHVPTSRTVTSVFALLVHLGVDVREQVRVFINLCQFHVVVANARDSPEFIDLMLHHLPFFVKFTYNLILFINFSVCLSKFLTTLLELHILFFELLYGERKFALELFYQPSVVH